MRPPRIKNARLVAAMAQAGITGKSLAAECGLHTMTVSALVNMRRQPTDETAKRIASVLRSTPAHLGFAPYEKGGAE